MAQSCLPISCCLKDRAPRKEMLPRRVQAPCNNTRAHTDSLGPARTLASQRPPRSLAPDRTHEIRTTKHGSRYLREIV